MIKSFLKYHKIFILVERKVYLVLKIIRFIFLSKAMKYVMLTCLYCIEYKL